MSFLKHLTQDFKSYDDAYAVPKPYTVRGICLLLFRSSQVAGAHWAPLGLAFKQLNHVLTGADIAWQARAGSNLNLLHPTGVVIGRNVVLGQNCKIQDGVTLGGRVDNNVGHPQVGDNVSIGCGAKVLGPVVIGDNVSIGANAVVIDDVPADRIAVGIPAKAKVKRL